MAFVPILVLLLLLTSDLWVYRDACARSDRGEPVAATIGSIEVATPGAWFALCLVLWIIFFPMYVAARR